MSLRAAIGCGCVTLMIVGCQQQSGDRLNAPPHGKAERVTAMQGTFVYMNDAALLKDMVVSDMHFLPHRDILNDLGVQRLTRLASLLEAYGGVTRYSTNEVDEELIADRLEVLVDFFARAGLDTTGEIVVLAMPGASTMHASEAVEILRAGRFEPKKSGSVATPPN